MWGIDLSHFSLISAAILWLVFLEGLLSADNALVLAMMVRHLPKPLQKRALRFGIWGAIIFRVLAVSVAWMLLDLWYLKVIGGLYLLYLAVAHVLTRDEGDDEAKSRRFGSGFWGTVVSVEIADVMFSIDSILAAVAMAEEIGRTQRTTRSSLIVIAGGILGIITMRFVAGTFILLLERFRGLEAGAYGLVAWIGLKLIAGGLHEANAIPHALNEWIFWAGMLGIVAIGFLYKPAEKKNPPAASPDSSPLEEVAPLGDEAQATMMAVRLQDSREAD